MSKYFLLLDNGCLIEEFGTQEIELVSLDFILENTFPNFH